MHETTLIGELMINTDVWKSFTLQQQEAVRSGVTETFLRWWVKWQRQNADAIKEMREKHGTQLLRTPPDVLIAFFKAWDDIAKEESAKNPIFKKVLDSQREYASIVVPAKRFMFPPYSFAANYYFPRRSRRPPKGRKVEVAALRCTVRGRALAPVLAAPGLVDPIKTSVYPAFAPVTPIRGGGTHEAFRAFGGGARGRNCVFSRRAGSDEPENAGDLAREPDAV